MERTKRWIKNNLLFFVSIIILFLSILFSVFMFYNFRIQANDFNTRVAHIYLGNDESQYESLLENAYTEFSEEAEYIVVYQNKEYIIDLSYYDIATDEILDVLVENQNNHAYFNVTNQAELVDELENVFGQTIIDQLSINSFINAIANQLSVFNYFVTFNLENYFSDSYKDAVLINKSYLVSDNDILDELPSELIIDIQGEAVFSILDFFESHNFSNKTLSYLASIIFDLTLESHFKHYQFYQPTTNPIWLEFDVPIRILKNNGFDFKFDNDYRQSYSIEIFISGSSLEANLVGSPYIKGFDISEVPVVVPYDTIYEDDPTLTDSAYIVSDDENETIYQDILTTGQPGEIIRYIRTITNSDNSQTTYEIYFTETQESISEVIAQNIVEKAGD